MRVKKGVRVSGLQPEMRRVLVVFESIFKSYGVAHGITITSTNDSVHSAGSLHPYGYAVDLRRWSVNGKINGKLKQIIHKAEFQLGSRYDIILEKTHIHIEFDHILKTARFQ